MFLSTDGVVTVIYEHGVSLEKGFLQAPSQLHLIDVR